MLKAFFDWLLRLVYGAKPDDGEPAPTEYCETCKATVESPHDCPKIGTNY
jgi:hypothetical protein